MLRKEQAGFRQERGTTEQIFILKNIVEQVCEWRSSLYVHFVDFEKSFDFSITGVTDCCHEIMQFQVK